MSNSTDLLYLHDTYLFVTTAQILDIFAHETQTVLILDQTIFYPQGGGQPSDVGFISSSSGNFEVTKTTFNPDGQVWHVGSFIDGKLEIGETVNLKIDEIKRLINSKNHTAGHLIDLAIEKLGLELSPLKGYHFPEGPYVEYAGNLKNLEFAKELEKTINEIIVQNPKISFRLENSQHQSGKTNRIMSVQGFKDCPCGGTHVQSTAEIGQIKIRKIKNNKGNIKISYSLAG